MKYILMMSTPRDGYAQFLSWPKQLLEANIAFMQDFARKLRESGELAEAAGLASPQEAKRVRAGIDGRPITDGVFPETKEFLAGYWIVDVESAERAFEIAAEASTAPGQPVRTASGEMIEHLWIEVRALMSSHREVR